MKRRLQFKENPDNTEEICLHWPIWESEEPGALKKNIQFQDNKFRLNRTRIAYIGQSGESEKSEEFGNLKRGFQWQGLRIWRIKNRLESYKTNLDCPKKLGTQKNLDNSNDPRI